MSGVRAERDRLLRRLVRRGLRLAGLGLISLAFLGGCLWFSTPLPSAQQLRARAALGNTRIFDRQGRLLAELSDPLSGRQRPVPLAAIPPALRQATIALEDSSFYQNPGFDLKGILRAAWVNLRSGGLFAGGSTITQQLARNFLLAPDLARQRTFERKLRETVLAIKLTATYSKDAILELYLNQVYYGGMSYGVEAAAQHYFGKPARDLDLAECALLAGLPQAPSRYDPFHDLAAARQRQGQALDALLDAGYITAEQAAAARDEPLQFAAADEPSSAPHFVAYAVEQLAAQLGPDAVARGGLMITTTLDIDVQTAAQSILARRLDQLNTPRTGAPSHRVGNGAVVVIDPNDGAILALVGSPDFADAAIQGQVNAALALRQPGSAIKPLTYAAALEHGWTPATTILDVPSAFVTREGHPYTPQNYDRTFHGPLTLREALATSSNVAAVRTLDAIGIPALLDMAERLGVASLGRDSGRYGLALTLGGGEVTLLELTSAYGVFANGGRRHAPYAITQVSAPGGEPIIVGEDPAARAGEAALDPAIAYLISDILADPYARMRAFGFPSVLDIDRPAAVKTGTTGDWRDNWTVGYTPDRVVGVWVGNADGQPMRDISGVSGAGPIWREVMLAAHRGLPPRDFPRPDGIIEMAVCAESGLLPTPACPAARLERFAAGTQPTRADDTYSVVAVDRVLGCRAPVSYPADRVVMRSFRRLPAEAEAWAADAGVARPPRDVCPLPTDDQTVAVAPSETSAGGTAFVAAGQPALLAPAPGAAFKLSSGVPLARQQIALRAQSGGNAVRLTIVVDGAPVAVLTQPPYRAFWQLTPGAHRAWVEVEDAQGRTTRSGVVVFTVE